MASYLEQIAKAAWESLSDEELFEIATAMEQSRYKHQFTGKALPYDEVLEWRRRRFEDVLARTIKIYEATKSVPEPHDTQ